MPHRARGPAKQINMGTWAVNEALGWEPVPAPGRMCTIYLLYRRDRTLLYVGLTGTQSLARFASHRKVKEWWPEVAFIELEHHPREAFARFREAELIRERKPLYNVAFNKRFAPKGVRGQKK